MQRSLSLAVAVSVLMAGGCANHEKDSINWDQDRQQVLDQLRQTTQSNQQLESELAQLDQRIIALQQAVEQQNISLQHIHQQQQLQQQAILALAGQHNELLARMPVAPSHRGQQKKHTAKRRQTITPAVAAQRPVTDDSSESASRSPQDKELEKNLYSTAYLAYKSARYDEAVRAFRQQLNDFPDGEYSASGLYWLAESLLAQKHYRESLSMFQRYIEKTPEGGKLASAMLGKARAERALHAASARQTLKRLIKRFPASPAAEQARQLMQQP